MSVTYTSVMKNEKNPAYHVVAADLAEDIEAGKYRETALPSISQLAAEYEVSTSVAQRAINLLDKWRMVTVEHGRASRPRAMARRITRRLPDRYQWEKDRAREPDEARRASGVAEQETDLASDMIRLVSNFTQIDCDPELAALLEVVPGSKVLHRQYELRPADEETPLAAGQGSWIPLDLVHGVDAFLDPDLEPYPGGTMAQFASIGIEIDQITDVVVARPAWPSEAKLLKVEIGDSVMELTKISRATTGQIVEVASIVLDGRRAELQFTSQLKAWS